MSEAVVPEASAPAPNLSVEEKLTAKAEAYFQSSEAAEPEAAEDTSDDTSLNDVIDAAEHDEDEGEEVAVEAAEDDAAPESDAGDPVPGSEDAPWTLKDLPDEHVTVKIDGEERTLSLKQVVENGMRQQTFDKRAHELKQLAERAESVQRASQENEQKLRSGITNTLSNPDQLMPYLDEHFPEVLDELALRHYPTLHAAHEAGELKAHMAQRRLGQKERALQAQQDRIAAQQRSAESSAETEARRATLVPAMQAAALAAKVTPTKEAMADIGAALNAREQSIGRLLTGEEIEAIATRFLRTYAETGESPKPRKPRARRGVAQGERRGATAGASGKEPPKRSPGGQLNDDWLIWRSQNKRQA